MMFQSINVHRQAADRCVIKVRGAGRAKQHCTASSTARAPGSLGCTMHIDEDSRKEESREEGSTGSEMLGARVLIGSSGSLPAYGSTGVHPSVFSILP